MSDLIRPGERVDGSRSVFRLARGSTGFCHVSDPPLPETDPRGRAAWYAAARSARGHVVDFAQQQYPHNFHSGTIREGDGAHAVLFHAQYPWVAFVDERRACYAGEFKDPPAWAATLGDFGFTVLSAPVLMSPLTAADTTALSAAEWSQIEHWKPDTLGAALFNSWD